MLLAMLGVIAQDGEEIREVIGEVGEENQEDGI
jgi:hypothetical protein